MLDELPARWPSTKRKSAHRPRRRGRARAWTSRARGQLSRHCKAPRARYVPPMVGSPFASFRWLSLRWLAVALLLPFAAVGCVNGAFDSSWLGLGSTSDETTP